MESERKKMNVIKEMKSILWLLILFLVVRAIVHVNVGALGITGFHPWWIELILWFTPLVILSYGFVIVVQILKTLYDLGKEHKIIEKVRNFF